MPRAERTREKLQRVALALVREGGYQAASVQAIAAGAGLSAGALYRHYPSKAALFVEVFRSCAARDMTAIDEAAASGSSIERFEAAVVTHARRALRSRRLAWALMYEPIDPIVDAERLIFRRRYCRHMAGLLRQGIAAGEIPDQNTELTAAALVGAIAESLVGPLSPVGGEDAAAEELIPSLLRFCRRGIGLADTPALRRVSRRNH